MATLKLTEKTLAALAVPADSAQSYYWDDELRGFGVVVGRTGRRTFVVRTRVNGALVKRTVGNAGQPREDGHLWTVQLARIEARKLLGKMANGEAAPARRLAGPVGATLREALKFHIDKMERGENRRGKVCSPRSIRTTRGSVELHLADYLDRPLVDLTADAIEEVMRRIERETPRRADASLKNPPGRAAANRIIANVSAIWRSYHKRHGLPVANPTERLMQDALAPRDTRIANDGLPAWHAKVMAMDNGVRRDLQLAAMFSGVRTDGIRNVRWEDLDWDGELIHIAKAKGDRPYTLPMTATLREIFERRRDENRDLMGPFGGDHGWVFPSLARDGKTVQPVAEVKERRAVRDAAGRARRDEDGEYVRETYLPGVHVSRRTYNSVAMEIGCPPETRERLLNHAGKGVNMKHYGQPQDWEHARGWADKIETALWARIKPAPASASTKRGNGKLRAV